MIVDMIVSDLVPLRERGNYMALVLVVYFVGTAIGPYVGGAIVEGTTWRWVFYINLPASTCKKNMEDTLANVFSDWWRVNDHDHCLAG